MVGEVASMSHPVLHRVCKDGVWWTRPVKPHPLLKDVRVDIDRASYSELGHVMPLGMRTLDIDALADTGAQMVVIGPRQLERLGVMKSELIPATMKILTADGNSMCGSGAILLRITAVVGGVQRSSVQQAYMAEGADQLFLSQECLVDLGCIEDDFPNGGPVRQVGVAAQVEEPGVVPGQPCQDLVSGRVPARPSIMPEEGWHPRTGCVEADKMDGSRPCHCPTRTAPPPIPTQCPFKPVAENVDKIKLWVGQYYASSAFNCCTNQKLPLVTSSPPLRLFVDPAVSPVAVHKCRSIPLHLQKEVKEELDRDIRIGVIEKVPVNTPSDWCSQMVVCIKKSGKA
jgi:hypothetical protein